MNSSKFAEMLFRACDEAASNAEKLTLFSKELLSEFLAVGSETPDNVNCSEHIEFGIVQEPKGVFGSVCGLKVKQKDILISDVINTIEDLHLPTMVAERFPDLTENEWRAILRMTTMVLSIIECDIGID